MIRPMPPSRKPTTMGPLSPSGVASSHSPTTPKLPGSAQTVISVEEWESKAPLGALELKSVAVIQAAAERKPLPLKFSARDEDAGSDSAHSASAPGTPLTRARALLGVGPSRPGTPSGTRPGARSHSLLPAEPVQTAQAFYDWSALVDRAVAHEQEAEFRIRLAEVGERLGECDRLVEALDTVKEELGSMLEEWRSVEASGESLKGACERLLAERDRLLQLTDDLEFRLEYFAELSRAAQMLNHPGESLVLQTDFIYMVQRVDVCIDFLKSHRHYKEAEIYLLRFQQCLTRAMSLIKMFFAGSLRALTADISKRMATTSSEGISATAAHHLLYTRFRTVATQVRPLLVELERRAKAHPEQLGMLREECTTAYLAARRQLLYARVMEEIRGLDPARTEIVELTRAGCSYLKQLCTDEFDLYRAFFDSGEEKLYEYLEKLCDLLYDDLRPRILHEQRLTALCEVCTVLQALMVLDVNIPAAGTLSPVSALSPLSATTDDNDDDDDELSLDLDGDGKLKKGDGLRQLQIARLLQMVLQDAQTRLFFKAQAVIQSEIRYFVPTAADLAYPDKIVEAQKPAQTENPGLREKESVSSLFRLNSREKEETWYPTLRKTVWVLAQLHDFVQPAIFEDIAQESLALCRISLVSAAENVKLRSKVDGELFLVRHLFVLKEIATGLGLAQRVDASAGNAAGSSAGAEAGGVTETLTSVLTRTSALLPNALFASLGMPRADDNLGDAKSGIDQELKKACESLITFCVDTVATPIRDWTARVRVYSHSTSSTKTGASDARVSETKPLIGQEWASEASARTLEIEFRSACERDLRGHAARMGLYLEDARTVGVLLGHVRERTMDEYVAFAEAAGGIYPDLKGSLLGGQEVGAFLRRVCAVDGNS